VSSQLAGWLAGQLWGCGERYGFVPVVAFVEELRRGREEERKL